MKREIKFRIWNGHEMITDVMAGKFGAFYVNPMTKGDGLDEKDSACISPFNTKYPNEVAVMQFTGLKDVNGVEIYDGDICSGHSDGNGVITWTDFDGGYNYVFDDENFVGLWEVGRKISVIGNIYQPK